MNPGLLELLSNMFNILWFDIGSVAAYPTIDCKGIKKQSGKPAYFHYDYVRKGCVARGPLNISETAGEHVSYDWLFPDKFPPLFGRGAPP